MGKEIGMKLPSQKLDTGRVRFLKKQQATPQISKSLYNCPNVNFAPKNLKAIIQNIYKATFVNKI